MNIGSNVQYTGSTILMNNYILWNSYTLSGNPDSIGSGLSTVVLRSNCFKNVILIILNKSQPVGSCRSIPGIEICVDIEKCIAAILPSDINFYRRSWNVRSRNLAIVFQVRNRLTVWPGIGLYPGNIGITSIGFNSRNLVKSNSWRRCKIGVTVKITGNRI